MEHSKKFVLLPEERLQNFVSEQLSELDEQMQSILRNKNMNDSEKATLYLQILRKYVNFPFPKEINEGMQEPQREFENSNAEDLKSDIPNEDSKEALGYAQNVFLIRMPVITLSLSILPLGVIPAPVLYIYYLDCEFSVAYDPGFHKIV
ncbi:hypothetical protein TNIN_13511 [Trichonephila inaurata madagascariensis]|uniref:Uncharacterized protein n=1 Tax=Trichonephila inaurata madagascariensis TaxID=2747483 RepID=A0A8X6YGY5_9ARAC|nr:hypothetical protein TNIN_13511 [Trichonephila inaurata madagascariensis]